MGGSIYSEEGRLLKWLPQVAFSDDLGSTFTNPKEVKIDPALMDDPKLDNPLDWLWRVAWHKGNGYAIDMKYEEINGKRIGVNFLVKTKDGIHYEKVSKLDVCKSLNECAFPNESTIRFDKKDKMYVLVRMARGDRSEVLVTAKPPYKNWVPQKLSMVGYIGGPNFLFLDKKTLILGGRSHDDTDNEEVYTGIKIMDLKGRVKKVFRLPSGW